MSQSAFFPYVSHRCALSHASPSDQNSQMLKLLSHCLLDITFLTSLFNSALFFVNAILALYSLPSDFSF
jgi:hypothetical protein